MKFIKLTARNNLDVIINTEKIQCITDSLDKATIYFNEREAIEVQEPIEEIYKMLEDMAK